MQILQKDNSWGCYSWADGFKQAYYNELSLDQEAKRAPQAVIFRLLRQGEEDLAEYFFQKYIAKAA